jgi:hypothetical protein
MWLDMTRRETPASPERAKPDEALLREQIDRNLRRVYEEALGEELPERLRLLVEQLRRETAAR